MLSKISMPKLKNLNLRSFLINKLGYSRLGNEGMKYLAKGKWPNLKFLNLCKNTMIQIITRLVLMDLQHLQKETGTFKSYKFQSSLPNDHINSWVYSHFLQVYSSSNLKKSHGWE